MEPVPHYASCSACGTSPVNHTLAYGQNVTEEGIRKVAGVFLRFIRPPQEGPIIHALYYYVFLPLQKVGLITYSADRSKVASTRSELIWSEAARRGIAMEQMIMLGNPLEQYRAKVNGGWIYFESLPIPYWLTQSGYSWIDDKLLLAERLREAGVAAPAARRFSSWSGAQKAFSELQKPVIIKPRIGSRGRHTTTHITTEAELKAAYDLGKQIARELVMEEHLFGSVYRATVINGRLVGFFRAEPPRVTGNGVHTVQELIDVKNEKRPERVGAIRVTPDALAYIARRGYTLASVLPKGEVLDLSAKTGRFYGGYTKEMLPEVHDKLFSIFAKAFEVVQIPVAGFDCIVPDPTNDPDTQKWGIIECNSLPFIDLHYFPLEGTPNDLAPHVWDLWKSKKVLG